MEDLALMLRSAVPIDDIDQLMISPTDGLAVIWVNISERPDLHALAARHEEEGSGYCICTFFYSNPGKSNMLIGLRVEMRQPTRTVFHLVLKVQTVPRSAHPHQQRRQDLDRPWATTNPPRWDASHDHDGFYGEGDGLLWPRRHDRASVV